MKQHRSVEEFSVALSTAKTPEELLVLHRAVLAEAFPHQEFAALHLKMAARYVELKGAAKPKTTPSVESKV